MSYNIGDRIRLVDPRRDQHHMLNWEGIVIGPVDTNTIRVRLYHPNNPDLFHEESYYDHRLLLLEPKSGTPILDVIRRLEKRQKFYKEFKAELPTWYACYGE